jgi:hypothetical protein
MLRAPSAPKAKFEAKVGTFTFFAPCLHETLLFGRQSFQRRRVPGRKAKEAKMARSERLTHIETIFATAVEQASACESKLSKELTVDAHPDYVRILVGGQSKVLFNVNAEGSIRGPIFGLHDTILLGSIDDESVEFNIAWAIKNELLDDIQDRVL